MWASVVPLKPSFFVLLAHVKREHFVLQKRGNRRVHGSGSTGIVFLIAGKKKKNEDFGDSWHNTHTCARMCGRASAHLLPQYWLLLGVRGYVFGPIEEKGNITSPVSIKSERQIGLHYCLGE